MQEISEEKKKGARKISIKEGCFSALSSGVGDSYIIPFAKEILATPFQIGMLNAFPGLVSPLAQFFGSRIMEKRTRKRIIVQFVLIQSLLWIPLSIIAILFWQGSFRPSLPFVLIIGYSLLAVLGGLAIPAWFSWMGDIVHEKQRGKYFSTRNRITGIFGMGGFLFGAFLLDYFKTKGMVLFGFAILFSLAFLFRFVAYTFFRRKYEPSIKLKKEEYYFTFWQFLRRYGNFVKFSMFMATFNAAMTIAGPFFIVYMFQELKFNYVTYMIVTLSATVFYLILAPLAGKFSDRFGNLKLIYLASALFSIYPLLWIGFKNPITLILITQFIGGVATAAYAISTTNFIYDTVTPSRRALCVSYMHILIGIGIFSGSLLGGFLLNIGYPSFINAFYFVFVVSAVFRATSSIIFLPKVRELRKFKDMPDIPHLYALHPFKLIQSQFVWMKDLRHKLFYSRR